MYTWHWDELLWKDVLVEIPDRIAVRDQRFDVVDYLVKLYNENQTAILEKQRLIRQHAFKLQYNYGEEHETAPQSDAFDIIMDSILDTTQGLNSGARKGSIPACRWHC